MEMSENWIITMGEVMLRLSPESIGKRIADSSLFRVEPGGSESNVAIALAHMGHKVRYITRLPDNQMGDMVINYLRGQGVNVDHVSFAPGRIGCYWTEIGSGPRPSKVIYDREYSVFSTWSTENEDWGRLLKDAKWFHSSGITPALCRSSFELLRTAKEKLPPATKKSFDLNYRKTLWTYLDQDRPRQIHELMHILCAKCDYVFGNETDYIDCLGFTLPEKGEDISRYQSVAAQFFRSFDKCQGMAVSLRKSHSASENTWGGLLFLRKKEGFVTYQGRTFNLNNIIDRVGAGDGFAAGLIHGFINYAEHPQEIINIATAMGAFMHTVRGDTCQIKETEVWDILRAGGSGKIIR